MSSKSISILLVLLLITLGSEAQTVGEMYNLLKIWMEPAEEPELPIWSERMDPTLFPDLSFCTEYENPDWRKNLKSIDLNRDGLQDAIYAGPCRPYSRVMVWLQTPFGFEKRLDRAGNLHGIVEDENGTHLQIRKEACCCDYWHSGSSHFFEMGETGFPVTQEMNISWQANEAFSKMPELKQISELKSTEPIILRYTPETDDLWRTDPCAPDSVQGNRAKEWRKGYFGIKLAESSGGWELVMVRKMDGEARFWVGWMKKHL